MGVKESYIYRYKKSGKKQLKQKEIMITENNKIIAKFMGYEIGFSDTSEPCILGKQNAWKPIKYHSDWNWLMEVVEKIETLNSNPIVIQWSRNNWTVFDIKLSEAKINSTHTACVEFIKWYNEQEVE